MRVLLHDYTVMGIYGTNAWEKVSTQLAKPLKMWKIARILISLSCAYVIKVNQPLEQTTLRHCLNEW